MARLPQIREASPVANPSQASAGGIAGRAAAGAMATMGNVARDAEQMLQPVSDQNQRNLASQQLADYDEAIANGEDPGQIALRREWTRNDQIYNRVIETGLTARSQLDAEEQIANLARSNENDPAAFRAAAEGYLDNALVDLPPSVMQNVELAGRQRISRAEARISDRVRANTVRETLDSSMRNLDNLSARRETLFEQYGASAETMEEYIEIVEQEDVLTSELADNPAYNLSEGWVEDYATNRANSAQASLLRHEVGLTYEQEGYVAALETIPALVGGMVLSDEDRASVTRSLTASVDNRHQGNNARRIEADRNRVINDRAERDRQEVAYNEMRVAMANGALTHDQMDQARDDSDISVTQWANLRVTQTNRDATAARQAAEMDLFLTSGAALDPSDPDHREYAETAFRSIMNDSGRTADFATEPMAFRDDMVAAALQFGVVPATAATALNGNAVNGNPEQIAQALDAISAINETAPAAALQAFDSRVLGDASMYASMVDSGIAPEAAEARIQSIREGRATRNPATERILQDQARAVAGEITWENTRGIFDRSNVLPGGRPTITNGRIQAAFEGEARSLFTTFFMDSGDATAARRAMEDTMRRTWGWTDVQPDRRELQDTHARLANPLRHRPRGGDFMRYPPEQYYAVPGADNSWMQEQLIEGVRAAAGDAAARRPITLVPDRRTAREAQNGEPPSYGVTYMDADGVYSTIPGRWTFDSTDARSEVQRGIEADMAEADAQRDADLADLPFRQLDLLRNQADLLGVRDPRTAQEAVDARDQMITDLGEDEVQRWDERQSLEARIAGGL